MERAGSAGGDSVSPDTIAAIATPPGRGGLGVIRVSGSRVREISRAVLGAVPKPRLASLRSFRDAAGNPLDQGIALFFPSPRSFTGEDSLELQGHGGPVVMDLLLARCLELGARLAGPGEFTQRAYLNGKLDLVQAEAVADLIESSTALAVRLAMGSLQGLFSRRISALVEQLIALRSLLEATLDFPDEDIEVLSRVRIRVALEGLLHSVSSTVSEASHGERIHEGLTVVIAGRPNAGKSSLLNALLQSDAAIVTSVPGTTRDLLRCDMQIDGLAVKLVDTAGIRDSREPVEQEGIRRARAQMELADLILWVYDTRLGLEREEINALPPTIPVTFVRNKIDLGDQPELGHIPVGTKVIGLSALTGCGIEELRQHLKLRAGLDGRAEGSFVARRRHLDALRRGRLAIERATASLDNGIGSEVVALDLLEAQRAFGEITGQVAPDDLLARIFSSFCIGK